MALLSYKRKHTRKPNYPVGIDWSNPLARGLMGAWFLSSTSRMNVVTGTITTAGGNAEYTHDGVYFPDTTDGDRVSTGLAPSITDQLTVISLVTPHFSTTTAEYPRIVDASDFGGAIPRGFRLQYNAGNDDYQFLIYNGANTNVSLSLNSSFQYEPVCIAVKYDGSNISIYKNGANKQSTAATGNITDTREIIIGNISYDLGNTGWLGNIHNVLVFNRALSDTEIKTLSDNPYQLLTPQTQYAFTAAASGFQPHWALASRRAGLIGAR